MPALVECVPNFSEGRDKAKVDTIIAAMKMDGVYLLDREMDADHNRCVITLVGDPVNVAEAAIRGVGKAAELIDLTKHTGAHPRLGAVCWKAGRCRVGSPRRTQPPRLRARSPAHPRTVAPRPPGAAAGRRCGRSPPAAEGRHRLAALRHSADNIAAGPGPSRGAAPAPGTSGRPAGPTVVRRSPAGPRGLRSPGRPAPVSWHWGS